MNRVGHNREHWVDAVKGLTIILVVFHHVFSGVRAAIGYPDWFLDMYQLTIPVRMPLFFLVAGFFAYKSIHGDSKRFVDSKLLHFGYFYLLWNTLNVVVRASLSDFTNNQVMLSDAFKLLWQPSFSLWFLYVLFLAFLFARLTRSLPLLTQFGIAIGMALTSYYLIGDSLPYVFSRSMKFYLFFLTGIYASGPIRQWVANASVERVLLLAGLFLSLATLTYFNGKVAVPGYFYLMAAASSGALMSLIYLLSGSKFFNLLTFVGARSLYIYLMHFVPAAGLRVVASRFGLDDYPIALTVGCTLLSVTLCILVFEWAKKIQFTSFLFFRPHFTQLGK